MWTRVPAKTRSSSSLVLTRSLLFLSLARSRTDGGSWVLSHTHSHRRRGRRGSGDVAVAPRACRCLHEPLARVVAATTEFASSWRARKHERHGELGQHGLVDQVADLGRLVAAAGGRAFQHGQGVLRDPLSSAGSLFQHTRTHSLLLPHRPMPSIRRPPIAQSLCFRT